MPLRKTCSRFPVPGLLLNRVGDAAHAFPPTGGLGLNSGLADAHSIAYKLAAILQGWANNSLLTRYEHERQHVAFINSEQSVKNGQKIFGFLRTLGATGNDVALARQNLYQSIHDPQKKAEIDAHIEAQREHFDNVRSIYSRVYMRRSTADVSYSSTSTLAMSTVTKGIPQMPPNFLPPSNLARDCLMLGSALPTVRQSRPRTRCCLWMCRTLTTLRPKISVHVNTPPSIYADQMLSLCLLMRTQRSCSRVR